MSNALVAYPIPRTAAHAWIEAKLPSIQKRCRAFFRALPAEQREDATAEVVAQGLQCAISAERRHRLHLLSVNSVVTYLGRAYWAGRRLAGSPTTDALSEVGRRRHGPRVLSLDAPELPAPGGEPCSTPLSDVLANKKAELPQENVRRDLDYPGILAKERVSAKLRRIFTFFCETAGEGLQTDLATELRVTPARVTQLKAKLAQCLARHDYVPTGQPDAERSDQRVVGPVPRRLRVVPLNPSSNPPRRSGRTRQGRARWRERRGRLTVTRYHPYV
jgi:hypothetical protein